MISIIIPVYNGEKSIARCIASVQQQSYTDIEIVVVDDGSVDKTREICKELEKSDSRIQYYYQYNQGVVAARALGLEQSNGGYIGFVDADDDVEPKMFETMLQAIEETSADISVCGYSVIDNKVKRMEIPNIDDILCGEEKILKALMKAGVQGFLWNKLFRKELIEKKYFHREMKMCEDFYMLCEMLAHKEDMKWTIIKEPLYNYYMETESATHDYRKLIAETGEWIPLTVYQKVETLFGDSKSVEIIKLAEAAIIKLALEQLKSQRGVYIETYENLVRQSRQYRKAVWKSNWSIRDKVSWIKVTFQK